MRPEPGPVTVIHDPDDPDAPDEPDETHEPGTSDRASVPTADPGVDPDAHAVPEPSEPGSETDDRRYPSTVGGACYLVVLGVGAAAVVIASLGDWRLGVRLLAGALGGAAAARLVLPQRDAGMLAVRHRLFDVVLLVAVGITLWVLAGDIPDQPGPVGVPG